MALTDVEHDADDEPGLLGEYVAVLAWPLELLVQLLQSVPGPSPRDGAVVLLLGERVAESVAESVAQPKHFAPDPSL